MCQCEAKIADAIRNVTAAMSKAFESGRRRLDADDIVETLLAIADQIDPEHQGLVDADDACPACGERRSDQLIWADDDAVRCLKCGATYHPGETPPTVERVGNTLGVMDADGEMLDAHEIVQSPEGIKEARDKVKEWMAKYAIAHIDPLGLI